ncbi:MAG: hypothetical protein WBG57_09125 [Ornithinimicrobium sp.]
MSVLALALISLGVADLFRLRAWGQSARGSLIGGLAGFVTLTVFAVLADLTSGADVLLLVVAATTVGGWVFTTTSGSTLPAAVPLLVMTGGMTALVIGSGGASPAGGDFVRWLAWTGLPASDTPVSPDTVLLVTGLALVQVATANTVVRLVLTQIGALGPTGSPQASDHLRGGRILGPMERLIILGLGLAGEVTAASLVIAAKGLIRWPELRHSDLKESDQVGVDAVTEYFLVGSMLSWILALLALATARLVSG